MNEELFNFENALGFLKQGCKLARKGWNGKGIFIRIACPMSIEFRSDDFYGLNTIEMDEGFVEKISILANEIIKDRLKDDMTIPYIYIDTTGLDTENEAAKKSVVPWLASQTDLLSEDWILISGS